MSGLGISEIDDKEILKSVESAGLHRIDLVLSYEKKIRYFFGKHSEYYHA